MTEWFFLLRGIALGLLVGMILLIWLRFSSYYALRVLAAFGVCLCGYLIAPMLWQVHWSVYIAIAFSDASVLMFLLLAQALFEDHQRPERKTLLFGALYLSYSYVEITLEHLFGVDTGWLRMPVRIAMLGGALYALYIVVRHWKQDLVAARRRLRLAVSAVTGCYVVGVTLAESLATDLNVPLWVEVINSAGILASLLIFSSVSLKLGAEGLLPEPHGPGAEKSGEQNAVSPPPQAVTNPIVEKVITSMEVEKSYRDMGLSIRGLADQLGVAEHRLRKLINQSLNYRNFNDFLNRYRLAEVAARLAEPAEAQIPILTIAMDAGYRSMTTFNRAFRAEFDQTPTDYRRQHCPISEKS
jgi:AraC-like DNA-binding protein